MAHEPRSDTAAPPPALALLRRAVEVEPREVRLLLLSGAYFFFVLASYYTIRPIRDEMAVVGGVENLAWLFTGTLLGTLMVHPLFTWVASRYPRKQFIPIAYRFFMANLVIFFLLLHLASEEAGAGVAGGGIAGGGVAGGGVTGGGVAGGGVAGLGEAYVWTGRIFFNWTSVFNLFVVSVFWAFMADIFRSEQGKRLFGFIGLGGTLGAMLGSGMTAYLATRIGPVNLLLVSALFLELALRCVRALGRSVTESGMGRREDEEEAMGGGVLTGIKDALTSPYLLGIILFMFLFTFTSVAMYFQQTEIVSRSFDDPGARTAFFARIDFLVNVVTLLTQAFLTGRIIKWFGLGVALAILPMVTVVGFIWLGTAPTLGVLLAAQVIRRGWNYGLMKPALEALYTVLPRQDKYKAKNFIDTFVYRTGDQLGAWSYNGLMALGLTFTSLAFVTTPLAGLWLLVGLVLGKVQNRKAREAANEGTVPAASAIST